LTASNQQISTSETAAMTPLRIAVCLLPCLVLPTGAIAETADPRTKVELPAPMRTRVLANMRGHLAAIETISRQLAAGDYGAAADTAESRLGVSAIRAHGGPQRAKYMPEGWRAMGFAMHSAASRLAIALRDAEVDDDLGAAFAGLAEVMQQCVACHTVYRVH
jgi:mono/diheme cytochrome c family protein